MSNVGVNGAIVKTCLSLPDPTLNNHGDGEATPYAKQDTERRLNVAMVHDYLTQSGGAERVVAALHHLYPESPIYTSVFDPNTTLEWFRDKDIRTSFLQKLPFRSQAMHKLALPLYPLAFEQFDLAEYDAVISSSSSFAKGIITGPQTCHICYCHTPARFAWRQHEYIARGTLTRLLSPMLSGTLSRLRAWDINSTNRVDYFVANSHNIASRISKYYRREAVVISPPVETERFHSVAHSEVSNNFLILSRLVGYKRVDLAIEVSNKMGFPLRVIGDGPELSSLKKIAGPNVTFLGRLADRETARELATCKALIFPGEEDFGITPLECMASGRPVIAFAAGGALETVVDGKTGVFFKAQTPESLGGAIDALNHIDFYPEALRAHAMRFDTQVFLAKFQEYANWAFADFQSRRYANRINPD